MASSKRLRAKPQQSGAEQTAARLGLEDLLGYNLRRAHAVQRARFRSVFAPYRIRPVQLTIIGFLLERSTLNEAALRKALDIKAGNFDTLVNELEHRQFVVRRPEKAGRRSHTLRLTPAGKKLARELIGLHTRLEQSLGDHLGSVERTELLRLLRKIRAAETSPAIHHDAR